MPLTQPAVAATAANETVAVAMESVEEQRGSVATGRERTEQANSGYPADLGGQALESLHAPPVEVEVDMEERRESRWANHPMGVGEYTVHPSSYMFHSTNLHQPLIAYYFL